MMAVLLDVDVFFFLSCLSSPELSDDMNGTRDIKHDILSLTFGVFPN